MNKTNKFSEFSTFIDFEIVDILFYFKNVWFMSHNAKYLKINV